MSTRDAQQIQSPTTTTRPFVIVTTRLPPAMCGIGANSAMLRRHWPADRPVRFLVIGEAATADPLANGDSIGEFGGNARRLLDELRRVGAADLLLHYAGRAYHRLGCPAWLPGTLQTWKREFPGSSLMVFFHEVPGRLPIRSRHYWLARFEARIIRRLARIADGVVTNTQNHIAQLRRITGRDDLQLVPVGTNIEVSPLVQPIRAADEFVLLGQSFGRLQTLRAFDSHVRKWSADGRLRVLHLIGPAEEKFDVEADQLINAWGDPGVVTRHGALPAAEVSRLLQRSRFALTNGTPETWSKSSAFMACASHRCAIVRAGARVVPLPLGATVVADELETISDSEVEARTNILAEWFAQNASWPVIAAKLSAIAVTSKQPS